MARITEVGMERTHTINVGNYESLKIGFSATVSIDEVDDVEEETERLREFIDTSIQKELGVLLDET